MRDYETNEAWTGEDQATQTASPQSDGAKSGASDRLSGPHIVARMPDLDVQEPVADDDSARAEGRLISRRWATRLLVGGVFLLLLAAVVPWWIERASQGEGGKPPRPNEDPAPRWDPQTAEQTPPTQLQPLAPELSLDVEISEGGLDFMNAPSGRGLEPGKAAAPPSPGPVEGNLETRNWDRLPEQPTLKGERPTPRVSALLRRRAWDNRAPSAESGYPPAAPQRTDSFQPPPNVSRGMMPDPADRRASMPNVEGPPMDPNRLQAAVNRPMSIGTPGPIQPGVARLEGFIQDPPVRMTYDRNGPGVH